MPSLILKRLRDRLLPSLSYIIINRMNCYLSVLCDVGLLWWIVCYYTFGGRDGQQVQREYTMSCYVKESKEDAGLC